MKVYVVTSGSYPDYTIERVFSNRLAAEEFKKQYKIQNDEEGTYEQCSRAEG